MKTPRILALGIASRLHLRTATLAGPLAILAALAIPLPVRAVDQTWTNGLGNFAWTNLSGNWSPFVWNNGSVDSAFFNTTGAGTITLGSAITTRGLSFTANGYTINGGGNNLTLLAGSGSLTNGQINTNAGISATINAVITGNVGLNKTGDGTLILNGANTYTTGTTVNAGTLAVGVSGAVLRMGDIVTVNGGSTFNYGNGLGINNSGAAIDVLMLNNGTYRVSGGSGDFYLKALSIGNNGGTVDFTGTSNFWTHFVNGAAITVDANSTWTGAGTSRIQNDSGSLLPISIVSGSTVTSSVNFVGNGAAGFRLKGRGTLFLNNPTSGNTADFRVEAGWLRVADMAHLGSGALTLASTVSSAGLQYSGATGSSTKALTLDSASGLAGGIWVSTSGTTLSLSGLISDNGGFGGELTVYGDGSAGTAVLALSGANTYMGTPSVVSKGVLSIATIANTGVASPLGIWSSLYLDDGTLRYTGVSASTNRTLSLGVGGTIDVTTESTTLTISGSVFGSGALTKSGAGTLALPGTKHYTGPTSVNAGTLQVSSGGTLNGTASVAVAAGGILAVDGTVTTGTGLSTVAAGGAINITGGTFNANGNLTLDGASAQLNRAVGAFNLAAGKTLTVQGGGDATFTGDYTNDTASTIVVSGAGSTLQTVSGFLEINGGSTLRVQGGGSVTSGRSLDIGVDASLVSNTLIVDGAGSSAGASASSYSDWGLSAPAVVTFSNNAAGSFFGIQLAAASGGSALVQVLSGADVVNNGFLRVAKTTEVGATASLTLSGTGATWTQTGVFGTTLGEASGSTATLNVRSGATFTSGTSGIIVNATGTLNLDGGTLIMNGPLANGGAVNFTSGALSLVQDFTVGAGGLLGASVTLGTDRTVTTSLTTTIDAFHTLTLDGGTLTTGALANNGTLDFRKGTLAITGAGGAIIGTGALGSSVVLGAGQNLQVTSTTTVASGATLRTEGGSFSGGALTNNGTIDHRGGAFAFTGTLTNNAAGRFFLSDTAAPAGAIANAGRITLQNGLGLLGGVGVITNTGKGFMHQLLFAF